MRSLDDDNKRVIKKFNRIYKKDLQKEGYSSMNSNSMLGAPEADTPNRQESFTTNLIKSFMNTGKQENASKRNTITD